MAGDTKADAVSVAMSGGHVQGVAGAGSVVIENFTIYNRAPDASEPAASDDHPIGPCPYPGLAYFGPNDAAAFFGRDATIDRLVAAIGTQSFTALVGSSGSGKSSVVLAGLAPRLHAMGGWRFAHFRIGNELDYDPFLALARALVPLFTATTDEVERLASTRKLAGYLRSGDLKLADVFADSRSQAKGSRFLLIADQFEECFTLVEDEAVRHRFIDVLLQGFPDLAPDAGPDISLILTMRADFYGRALQYRPLADALQGHVENLGPMSREELRQAIVQPSQNAKVSFEPGLVETLLDDVESKPGSLPLLQFALREMWASQEKRQITRKSYDAIGGVQGALARRAESIYASMTDCGANAVMAADFQRLFTRLVTPGEGQEDTRRIAERRELGDEVWSLAQRLAGEANRLLVTSAPAPAHETAEVVHEALIRNWPTLAGWITRDRAFLSWLRQIKPTLELWLADPGDEGPLLRGGMLAQASDWFARRSHDLSPEERRYVETSLALRRREKAERETARQMEVSRQRDLAEAAGALAREQGRRAKMAIGGVIVAALLAAFGAYQAYSANQQKILAEQQRVRADAAAAEARRQADLATSAERDVKFQRDRSRMQLLAMQARRAAGEGTSGKDFERAAALALESIAESREQPKLGPPEAAAIEALGSALANLPSTVLTHGGLIWSLATLPDGRLVSSGEYGEIRLWPKDGTAAPQVLSHGSNVTSVAILTDGRLASGGIDGQIRLWPKEGKAEPEILRHGSVVNSLAALPGGLLASGGEDGTIKIWLHGSESDPTVLSPGSSVLSLSALPDGRLASSDVDGKIRIWPKGYKGEPVVWIHGDREVESLTVLTDGRLASGGADGDIKLWPKDGDGAPVVLKQGSNVWSLASLADGRLASSGMDGKVRIWPQDLKGDPSVLTHGGGRPVVAVMADGRLVSGGDDGEIRLWPKGGKDHAEGLSLQGSSIGLLAVLADGRLATDYADAIAIWPKDGKAEPEWLFQDSRVSALAALVDGRLASGGDDGKIRLWPKDGKGEPAVLQQDGRVASLQGLGDGHLVSSNDDGKIMLWPEAGKGEPAVLSQDSPVTSFAAFADGRLASGGDDGKIRLWPKDRKGEPEILLQGSRVTSLQVLADGRLASGDGGGKIRLWPKDGKGAPAILLHGDHVASLQVLVDGRLVSGGGFSRKIRLWPADGKGEPVVLSSPVGWLSSLAVLADGRLASIGDDGTIKFWTVNEEDLILAVCLRSGRNLPQEEWDRYVGPDRPRVAGCGDRPSNWRD